MITTSPIAAFSWIEEVTDGLLNEGALSLMSETVTTTCPSVDRTFSGTAPSEARTVSVKTAVVSRSSSPIVVITPVVLLMENLFPVFPATKENETSP